MNREREAENRTEDRAAVGRACGGWRVAGAGRRVLRGERRGVRWWLLARTATVKGLRQRDEDSLAHSRAPLLAATYSISPSLSPSILPSSSPLFSLLPYLFLLLSSLLTYASYIFFFLSTVSSELHAACMPSTLLSSFSSFSPYRLSCNNRDRNRDRDASFYGTSAESVTAP